MMKNSLPILYIFLMVFHTEKLYEKLFERLFVFSIVLTHNKTIDATFCFDSQRFKVYDIVLIWYFMFSYFKFSYSIFRVFSLKNHDLRAVGQIDLGLYILY
jgi:hypothetical protein